MKYHKVINNVDQFLCTMVKHEHTTLHNLGKLIILFPFSAHIHTNRKWDLSLAYLSCWHRLIMHTDKGVTLILTVHHYLHRPPGEATSQWEQRFKCCGNKTQLRR
ncbi:hypothetical protein VP01_1796g2 [Puccinia sorghi]|uniref:Uncharacterized protein n=1 Tax=Puccinia sorghi TaxID=27349 RepID=A0A0L6VEC4_9BASI|nr:hypothetical protein VP01_1796g2 [Puccinia sorghi]